MNLGVKLDLCVPFVQTAVEMSGFDSLKDTFYNQPIVPASHLYRTDIANLDSKCFMAGNRGSVGVSPNVLNQVNCEVIFYVCLSVKAFLISWFLYVSILVLIWFIIKVKSKNSYI